jgi:hypothetical protein
MIVCVIAGGSVLASSRQNQPWDAMGGSELRFRKYHNRASIEIIARPNN